MKSVIKDHLPNDSVSTKRLGKQTQEDRKKIGGCQGWRVWWVVKGNGRDRCCVQVSFGGSDVLKLIVGMGELVTESGQIGWCAN